MKRVWWLLLLLLLLTGCAVKADTKASDEASKAPVVLVLASFGTDSELQKQIDIFNENHSDYKIEMKQYYHSDQAEEDGIHQLQREIVSGAGPDIINFGRDYQTTDIIGAYTEDLFSYLQEDRTNYFTNIWDAFSYQGKLYAVPVDFTLKTFVARKSVIGEKKSWTIEELADCYEKAREKIGDSFMLYPGETKKDVFGSLVIGNVGNYVDWEKGTCNFTSDDFKNILAFSNHFPDTLTISEEFSPMQLLADGNALIMPFTISSVYDISKPELLFKEESVCIGYPTAEADGTVIKPGNLMLAISTGSGHKEAAWEFIRQFLAEEYQENLTNGLPVCKSALEKQLTVATTEEYTKDSAGNEIPKVKSEVLFEGENPINIYKITEEQKTALLDMVEAVSIASAYDRYLQMILLEEADGYFNGDKSLEQAIEVIQGRASIYIQEKR